MREVRTYEGILQKELAQVLDVSPFTYSHYETNDLTIPIKQLIKFCNYFDVSLDYIFGLNDLKQYKNINKEINSEKAGLVLKQFRKDNKLTQDKLANILKTNRSVLANYERGRNFIATPFLYDLCKKYDVSADYILGRIDYNPKEKNLV